MSDELPVVPDFGSRLEPIVFLRHFFGGESPVGRRVSVEVLPPRVNVTGPDRAVGSIYLVETEPGAKGEILLPFPAGRSGYEQA